ncbi:A24 family peptidase [Streptomyces sp. AC555_RSS877]|uniref:prepilin peptidase n=1 Tax=Streptomyces sp. AC555_RSS877 TaxID=2823688 RepID=UPI001C264C5D|nr:A24 family peptidase [Streptomyces sp. AC555_RSS877]
MTGLSGPVGLSGLLIAVAAVWGAVTGALVPRAAYRFSVPPEEAWRQRCPGGHPIRGWLGRARCGECAGGAVVVAAGDGTVVTRRSAQGRYGPRAPVLALVTALLCAGLAAATDTRPEIAVWLLLAPVGVLLAVVDLRVQRLPDVLTLPLAGAALVLLGLVALVPEHAGSWPSAALGALALGAGYLVLWLANPGGMGFGDVKLALGTGALLGWYGWGTVLLGTLAGFLSGALYGGALVVARRAGRRTAIPFGPFLIAGAYLGLLTGAYAA